jgi:hypothetical protein
MIAANGNIMLGRVDREVESLVLEEDSGINMRRNFLKHQGIQCG